MIVWGSRKSYKDILRRWKRSRAKDSFVVGREKKIRRRASCLTSRKVEAKFKSECCSLKLKLVGRATPVKYIMGTTIVGT